MIKKLQNVHYPDEYVIPELYQRCKYCGIRIEYDIYKCQYLDLNDSSIECISIEEKAIKDILE